MCLALLATLLSLAQIAPVRNGNALTLPAARHLVRLEPGRGHPTVELLALQQDGAQGHGLGFFRSDDDGKHWSYYKPVQDDFSERDTVDLISVGNDVALVYSYEGPVLSGSARHNVFFQWWRFDGVDGWSPGAKVEVFASGSAQTAYSRAELARDSLGRLWVQAMHLLADGTHLLEISVSTDRGATFAQQAPLDHLRSRPGGRLASLGTTLVMLYGTHGAHGASNPGRLRLRHDSDPLGNWGPVQTVLPEGLYHGAALSTVADKAGGWHVVYKDLGGRLWYRHFDGTAFGNRQAVEPASDWALQPAISLVGSDLVIFWNHPISVNTDYQLRTRTLSRGVLGPVSTLDASTGFKGYPAAIELLPAATPAVPCSYSATANAASAGNQVLVLAGTGRRSAE